MIDLTNKPEGATHYTMIDGEGVCWYKIGKGNYKYLYDDEVDAVEWADGIHEKPAHAVVEISDWSIYSNTNPLSELSDEQAAELFNYCRNGGEVEILSGGNVWLLVVNSYHMIIAGTYRAKQKSERELFIEASCRIMMEQSGYDSNDNYDLSCALFNAGFKAPKVGG